MGGVVAAAANDGDYYWTRGGSGKRDFVPCPPGPQQLVCVDIVDLGYRDTVYKGQKKTVRKTRLVFESIDTFEAEVNGKKVRRRYTVSTTFTASLAPNAWLRGFLEAWRGGKKLTDDEADRFNPEMLIGANGLGDITHTDKDGVTYANVNTIMRLPANIPTMEPSADYVRVKDRPAKDGSAPQSASMPGVPNVSQAPAGPPLTDEDFHPEDDLPF
jgi:hypothetical protein